MKYISQDQTGHRCLYCLKDMFMFNIIIWRWRLSETDFHVCGVVWCMYISWKERDLCNCLCTDQYQPALVTAAAIGRQCWDMEPADQ